MLTNMVCKVQMVQKSKRVRTFAQHSSSSVGKVKKRYFHLVWWKRCSMNTTQKGQFRNCRETQYFHQHRGWEPSSKFCVLKFAFFLVFVCPVVMEIVRGSVSKWGVLCLLCFELCLLCWCLVFSILIIGGGCVKMGCLVLTWDGR